MTTVHVAIPVVSTKTQLTILKGRPWSVVEHLVLSMLVKESMTIDALAKGLSLQRALITASLSRLMAVRWIELRTATSGVFFYATALGREASAAEKTLPYRNVIQNTVRSHLYERATGHVFRPEDLRSVSPDAAQELCRDEKLVIVRQNLLPEGYFRIAEIEDVLLNEDESLAGMSPGSEHYPGKVAVFTVIDTELQDWPITRDLNDLKTIILRAAETHRPVTRRARQEEAFNGPPVTNALSQIPIEFQPTDLVIGAQAHLDAFEFALREAHSRVIIHSTFLGLEQARNRMECIRRACERKVIVDVLWGQEIKERVDTPTKRPLKDRLTAIEVIQRLKALPDYEACRGRLRFHEQSTRSHCKAILFDLPNPDRFVAFLGSCNWLASGYYNVEASVYLRSPVIVRKLADCLASAIYGGAGFLSSMTDELLRIGKGMRKLGSEANPNGTAALVVDNAHIDCMYRAQEKVSRRVLLVSHRLGPVARPGALVPLAMACGKEGVSARVYYGKPEVSRHLLSQWTADAQRRNVHVRPVKAVGVHAKMLAWDDDTVVISSQNWLSADPAASPMIREVGVMINASGIATRAIDLFDHCLAGGSSQLRWAPSGT